MNAFFVLGLLALCGTGDSIVTWVAPGPVSAVADFEIAAEYFHEGSTAFKTLVAFPTAGGATLADYAITSQTVAGFFVLATPATGAITLAAANSPLDGATTTLTHVLKIEGRDSTPLTGTATYTIIIKPAQFKYGFMCIYVAEAVASGVTIETNLLSSTGTNTYAIASGNTNTDFEVSTVGVIATATGKTLTPASGTNGGYNLVITGADDVGTVSTVTSTVSICVRGSTCTCTYSAAAHMTAGMLGLLIYVFVILLK